MHTDCQVRKRRGVKSYDLDEKYKKVPLSELALIFFHFHEFKWNWVCQNWTSKVHRTKLDSRRTHVESIGVHSGLGVGGSASVPPRWSQVPPESYRALDSWPLPQSQVTLRIRVEGENIKIWSLWAVWNTDKPCEYRKKQSITIDKVKGPSIVSQG